MSPTPSPEASQWTEDLLGPPYLARTLPLRADDEGEVIATLVHRPADGRDSDGGPPGRAVLHVHGFADYFFQTVAADFWCARGYDFYALDLRKYGRSLRPYQRPNYVADLATYGEELDLAWSEVTRAHGHVVLSAHSTGGLTVPLWLHERGHQAAGLFLNSPWIDMQGGWFTRSFTMPVIHRLGGHRPHREIPRKVSRDYAMSLHREHSGEWDFDLALKPLESFPVYAGWIRAIRTGQARVALGLDVHGPVLMLTSARSGHPTSPEDPVLRCTDVVLDVDRLRSRASRLARHVTIAQIEGAIHDVTLSPEPARSRVFAELDRWLTAYVER